jgi:ditrans,polycis-polyprenyl diphosphate synthase
MSWFQADKRTYLQKIFGKIIACGVVPKHVAFIMDGNRRYAKKNKIAKIGGHRGGFDKLAEVLCFPSWSYVFGFLFETFKLNRH